MSAADLKTELIKYPGEAWDVTRIMNQYSQPEFVDVLCEILEEYGGFPAGDGARGVSDGLTVTGSEEYYTGHWNTHEEGGAISTASENLGDSRSAAYVIFRSCFYGCTKSEEE